MNLQKGTNEITDLLISGYEHYSRETERHLIERVLKGEVVIFDTFSPDQFILAAQPLRSAKNLIICLVAVTCRVAADLGADDHKCYALSDTYINTIEEQAETVQVFSLVKEIFLSYHALVEEGLAKPYSQSIQRAIRFIHNHVYDTCRLDQVAREINLHPAYFSRLFREEVGINFNCFVRDQKIEEAKKLLRNTTYSISEIAEILSFSSLSYFSKVFKLVCHCSPQQFSRKT